MEELIGPLFNLGAHIAAGMVVGKGTREKLKIEDDGLKNKILDACLGAYPDVDNLGRDDLYGLKIHDYISSAVRDCLGKHRGNFHIPVVELLAGGSVTALYYSSKKQGKPEPKEMLKYFVSGGLTSLTHFSVDLLSGGETPVWFGKKLEVYPFVGRDYVSGLLFHGGIMVGSLLYVYRKEITKFLRGLYGRNNK